MIGRADGQETERTSTAEDDSRATRGLIIVTSSVVPCRARPSPSGKPPTANGSQSVLLERAIAAVVVSWFAVHTDFTLRYAHLYYTPAGGRARDRRRAPA